MPRDLPLANGHLLVNFDSRYNLRDIYWPHIGERNQTDGHVSHSGVWVDGAFAWFDADGWQRSLVYEEDTLVTNVTLTHPDLHLTIVLNDVVDFDRDVFIRRARVTNTADHQREVRLFFHHDWHLWESEGGNTVYYSAELKSVIAYKDECYILVNGVVGDDAAGAPAGNGQGDAGVSQWATGYKEFNGQQGTWKDAEDGELGRNPIAQGSVDSCAGFNLGAIAPGGSRVCTHWLAVGENFPAVRDLNRLILERGPDALIERTHNYWHLWVGTKEADLGDLPDNLVDLYKRSLLLIRTQIDDDGAIIAATDGDVWTFARDSYAYMWPRDGALVANAMSHSGYSLITGAFFHFCAQHITEKGYLLHKYTPAGALGSSWHPWSDSQGNPELPIQEDETALVVYALWQHYKLYHEVEFVRPLYRSLVKAAGDFMVSYREPHTGLPQASWDLWEERHGIHAYTVAAVHAGLTAASRFAQVFGELDHAATYQKAAEEIQAAARRYLWSEAAGRFVRMINVAADGSVQPDMTIDASITGLYQFGMIAAESDEMRKTMEILEQRLTVKTPVGGVARYENDYYHQVSQDIANVPGNPWFICACWLAEYRIASAQTHEELHTAVELLEWVRARALPSGVLAEQVDPYTDAPLSVSPLTWSHAEFVQAVRWYAGKHRRLDQQSPTSAPFGRE
ncbi:MAG: glycoside hydrolase family 15 protein [Ktedonobacterales bacterium]